MAEKKYLCYMCDNEKVKKEFYAAREPFVKAGLIPYCKDCLKAFCYVDDEGGNFEFDFGQFMIILKFINRPFLSDLWNSAKKEADNSKSKDYFGIYMKNVQMNQYKDLGWGDSQDAGAPKLIVIGGTDKTNNHAFDFQVTSEIEDRWGYGYKPEEYKRFEKKYEEISRSGVEKTALHSEFLLQYIRYAVKSEIATAANDAKGAKDWGELAIKAAASAKIKPEQLKPEDFSDGLDSVGQIVRAVEQQVDIVSVLPKFKGISQDLVDFTVLQFVNYIRRLKGLRECEYPDLYKFTDEIAKEYRELADKYVDCPDMPPDEPAEDDGNFFEDDEIGGGDTCWGDADDQ